MDSTFNAGANPAYKTLNKAEGCIVKPIHCLKTGNTPKESC